MQFPTRVSSSDITGNKAAWRRDHRHHTNDNAPPKVVPTLPRGVLAVHLRQLRLKSWRIFSTMFEERTAVSLYIRLTTPEIIKCTAALENNSFPSTILLDELKHFRTRMRQNQKSDDNCLRIELIGFERPEVHVVIGSDTINLYDIVKNLYWAQKSNLDRLGQTVAELDIEMCYSYGGLGFGHSNQLGLKKMEPKDQVGHSLFYRANPPTERLDEPHHTNVMKARHVGHPAYIPFTCQVNIGEEGEGPITEESICEYPMLMEKMGKRLHAMQREYSQLDSRRQRLGYLREMIYQEGMRRYIGREEFRVPPGHFIKPRRRSSLSFQTKDTKRVSSAKQRPRSSKNPVVAFESEAEDFEEVEEVFNQDRRRSSVWTWAKNAMTNLFGSVKRRMSVVEPFSLPEGVLDEVEEDIEDEQEVEVEESKPSGKPKLMFDLAKLKAAMAKAEEEENRNNEQKNEEANSTEESPGEEAMKDASPAKPKLMFSLAKLKSAMAEADKLDDPAALGSENGQRAPGDVFLNTSPPDSPADRGFAPASRGGLLVDPATNLVKTKRKGSLHPGHQDMRKQLLNRLKMKSNQIHPGMSGSSGAEESDGSTEDIKNIDRTSFGKEHFLEEEEDGVDAEEYDAESEQEMDSFPEIEVRPPVDNKRRGSWWDRRPKFLQWNKKDDSNLGVDHDDLVKKTGRKGSLHPGHMEMTAFVKKKTLEGGHGGQSIMEKSRESMTTSDGSSQSITGDKQAVVGKSPKQGRSLPAQAPLKKVAQAPQVKPKLRRDELNIDNLEKKTGRRGSLHPQHLDMKAGLRKRIVEGSQKKQLQALDDKSREEIEIKDVSESDGESKPKKKFSSTVGSMWRKLGNQAPSPVPGECSSVRIMVDPETPETSDSDEDDDLFIMARCTLDADIEEEDDEYE